MDSTTSLLVGIDFLLIVVIVFTNIYGIVVIMKKSKKNSKNLLLVSLSVSDIAVAMFVIPNIIFLNLHNSSVSPVICQLCLFTEYMASAANVFSISVLAIDRFRALMFPLQNRTSNRGVVYGTIVLIWVACIVYAVRAPVVYRSKMFKLGGVNSTAVKYGCAIPDSLLSLHSGLIVLDAIVLFAVPAVVLVGCNITVSLELCKKTAVSLSMPETVGKRRRRAIRVLLILILIFITLNFPLHYFRMAKHVFKQKISGASTIGHIFLILTFINNSVNVFFYGLLNEDLKSVCLVCWRKKNQVAPDSSGTTRMMKTKDVTKSIINKTEVIQIETKENK